MNEIYIGTKTQIQFPKNGFLYINDEVPDLPRARVFDPTEHSFNPLGGMNYRKLVGLVDLFDTLFSRGENTLTKDTGLDYIAESLGTHTGNFETLIPPPGKGATTGQVWAYGKVQRLMRSPVIKDMLSKTTNFSFKPGSSILARVNRAELGDFDALAIGQFLMGHFKGHIIVLDGGFYLRNSNISLIRENRLIAGVRFLDELPLQLRKEVLLVENKITAGALYEDAVLLAKHAGLHPDLAREDNRYNRFIAEAMEGVDSPLSG